MNFSKKVKSGFTLIELLVVVAIIGILASVVLASLNTARSKGSDAAIKANLDNMRAEAAIYYDGTGAQTYGAAGNCSVTSAGVVTAVSGACTGLMGDTTFANGVKAAAAAAGATAYANTSAAGAAYAAFAPLKSASPNWWCVDSTGVSQSEAAPATTATNC